jgi:cyclase
MGQLVDLGTTYAWLQDEPRPGATNSGVIIDEDGITIVDAQLTPAQGEELFAAVDALGLPIRRLALTSSHMPFVGGSSAFVLPAVYGTAQVSAHMDQEPNIAGCCALYPADSAELQALDDHPCRRVTHTVSEAAWLTASVVTAPLAGELDENLIVQVPEAQIVFGGAMCSFAVTPMAGLGDPQAWADSLDTLLGWGEIFVPGHGPIGGKEEVAAQQAYLNACVAAQGDPSALGDGPWREWSGQEYHAINIERAALLAEGNREPPTSLLRLLGGA